jgi:hypothetical protein
MARDPAARLQTPAELVEAVTPFCELENGPSSRAEVATRYSLNTPADRDSEPGTGWVLEDAFPREAATSNGAVALPGEDVRELIWWQKRRRKWPILLAAVMAFVLIFLMVLFLVV